MSAETETTLSAAERGLAERLGTIERVANGGRAWRHATFACCGLLGFSLLVHAFAFGRTAERFYVVELDRCSGESKVVGPITEHLTFRDVNIVYMLEHFVMDMRGVSTDIEVTKAQWRRLREQVTPEGAQLLNQTEAELQPLQQKGATAVKVIRVQQREGTRYDVRWQERRYGTNGELSMITNWGGLFTFRWETPRKAAPLGMLFSFWQFKQES
jgi:type IV secretory pathway TrbF-like protein